MSKKTTAPAAPGIDTVRQHLLDTLASLTDRANPMPVDRAKAIAQVASVLVESAKAETDYIRSTRDPDLRSSFIGSASRTTTSSRRITSGIVHQLAGGGIVHRIGDEEDGGSDTD